MPSLTKLQLDAAQEFASAAIAALKSATGIHPGTVIAATARMAGTYLFRSFGLRLPQVEPGQAVLSEEANVSGPTLIEIAARLLSRIGVALDGSKAARPVPLKDQPTRTFLDTQRTLERAFWPVRTRYGFNDEEAAYAVAAATSLLIRHCAKALDSNSAFAVAATGFVEGTKTMPEPFEA
jgi:hypothetical protein